MQGRRFTRILSGCCILSDWLSAYDSGAQWKVPCAPSRDMRDGQTGLWYPIDMVMCGRNADFIVSVPSQRRAQSTAK